MGDHQRACLKYRLIKSFKGKFPGQDTQLVAYGGNSMKPTLREAELMEVSPYHDRPIRRGDVIYFTGHDKVTAVVHRVIGITDKGVMTQGDNNPTADEHMPDQAQIIGRVTAVWSGMRKRIIRGGWQGHLIGLSLHGLYWLDDNISSRLSPVYQALCKNGFLSRILPPSLRPWIVQVKVDGKAQFLLFWVGIMIGRYSDAGSCWIIRRPFRLVVNDALLDIVSEKMKNKKKND